MKVYVVTGIAENTIRCVCNSRQLAEQIKRSFDYLNLTVVEFDLIEGKLNG